ncbi:MAG TPA: AAA family ATPase [Gaiellaceae bacterium]|jgi:pilus assembly protein CpaE|nr:AAA family ATPase [Gaiellaceae bacterium]
MTEHTDIQRTRLYFTGDCDGFSELKESLAQHPALEVIGSSEHVAQASGVLAGGHLECILHATRSERFPTAEVAAIREQTRAPIVIVASGSASEILEDALDADVSDVLLLPQLVENVLFVVKKASHAKRALPTVTRARFGRVITVFSPKGGTGKTVTASNLGAALAKQGKNTLLLDLDLQFGDAAIVMGIEPEKTVYDLVVAPGELDHEKLAGYITKHPCGLDVLPAPLRPEDAELVTESKITRLLEVARETYDVIVVDTSPFFHGPMLATLDRTDELLVICGLDVPTLKNVRLALQTLELLAYPTSRIRFVLNHANMKVGLSKREVETALKVSIDTEVPSDRAVPVAVNQGNPAVLSNPSCDFSRAMTALAKTLIKEPAKKTTAKSTQRRRLSMARS